MKKNLAILFAAAAMLSACGGFDDSGPAAPTPAPAPAPGPAPAPTPAAVPDTAAASTQSFFDYLVGLIATKSETAEPLTISSGFNAAVSETEEPKALP